MRDSQPNSVDEDVAAKRIEFGLRLKQLRESIGETQEQFAERLGVGRLAVLRYESGLRSPGIDQIQALMDLDVDLSLLVFGKPSIQTKASRELFSRVLVKIDRECQIRSQDLPIEKKFQIAWIYYNTLTNKLLLASPVELQDHLNKSIDRQIARIKD